MKKQATLADVAQAAGVSKMTASRALRGTGDVSRASLEKVRRAAEDIGYVGNPLAMSLSSQRSDLIGVVVPSLANIVFAEVLSGIAERISASGIQPVFGVTDYDPDREHLAIRSMLSWRPAGLIVTGLDQPARTRALLENADLPIVQIMDLDGAPVDSCVGFSHREAGADIATALIGAGRCRFGYVGSGLEIDSRARKRLAGFEAALSRNGLSPLGRRVGRGPSTATAGREMTAQLLSEHPDLDCIYFSNDDMAMGGLFHCIAAGIAVPGDVMLAGFNGLDIIDSLPIPIATSRTPRRDIGMSAAGIILQALDGGQAGKQTLAFRPKIDLGLPR